MSLSHLKVRQRKPSGKNARNDEWEWVADEVVEEAPADTAAKGGGAKGRGRGSYG